MDKNSIIGILIIAAILIVWGVVFGPDKTDMEQRQRQQDSLALVLQQQAEQQQINQTIADSAQTTPSDTPSIQNVEQLGEFSGVATGKQEFITLENDLIKMVISTLGGRPYSVELKQYKTHGRTPVVLFSGDSTEFGLYL